MMMERMRASAMCRGSFCICLMLSRICMHDIIEKTKELVRV